MEKFMLELKNNFDEEEQGHYSVVLFHVLFIYNHHESSHNLMAHKDL
jgi:hypothetical protein